MITYRGGSTMVQNTAGAGWRATLVGALALLATACGGGARDGVPSTPARAPVTAKAFAGLVTSTALTASPAAPVTGESVAYAATVTLVDPADSLDGVVDFTEGTSVLCAAVPVIPAGDGQTATAECRVGHHVGRHHVVAAYHDAAPDEDSSGETDVDVHPGDTLTTVAADVAAPVYGQPVTFTATVAAVVPAMGIPAGAVTFTSGGYVLCPDVPLVTGVATCLVDFSEVGPLEVTAAYGGEDDFLSSRGSGYVTVAPGATTTSLYADSTSSFAGYPLTFTAVVSPVAPAAGTPTGYVTFADGDTVLCAIAFLDEGVATCTTSTLAGGTHTITASYSGSSRFETSAGSVNHEIVQVASRTTVAVAPSPSVIGQAVTFTATVVSTLPSLPHPTGTVDFADGASVLCGGVVLHDGRASCTVSRLPVGAHRVTASYGGSNTFRASSGSADHVVGTGATTTVVASSLNPSAFGQRVTFTASVTPDAPAAGTPTGTVTFTDGLSVLCPAVAMSGGSASCETSTLGAGSHFIVATYSGDGSFDASESLALGQVVQPGLTTTTVVSSLSPSTLGQSVTFTATVTVSSPASGTPDGTVAFTDGATTLCAAATLSSGVATCTVSQLAVGSHAVQAAYAGSSNFVGSTGRVTQVVDKGAAKLSSSAAPSPSVPGQPVTFTMTVAPVSPAFGTPTGTVTITEGDTTICSAVALTAGSATCSSSTLAVGSHALHLNYSGDASFEPASGSLTQVVGKGDTSTALVASPSPSVYGQSVTYAATVSVTAPAAGVPTGTVAFTEGATTLCAAVPVAGGVATCTVSGPAVGSHAVSAQYSGDGSFNGSSGSTTQVVNKGATSTVVVASPSPSVYGQSVTFTATVSVTAPAVGTLTGTVAFTDGATTLCASAPVSAGVATCTTSALAVGSHPVGARYSGDGNFDGSSGSATQVVNKGATSTVASASPSSSVYGQPVTFTATVSVSAPAAGTLTGTVTFTDGATTLCAAAPVTAGVATCSPALLAVGSHAVSARYNGDGSFESSSGDVSLPVGKGATSTVVVAGPSPSVYGQSVTFTATVSVTAPASGVASGTVAFTDGSTTLCAAVPVSEGTATCTTSTLAVGSHPVGARYSGNGNFESSSGSVTHVVKRGDTSTALAASPSPSVYGQSVTFTATVSATAPAAGTLTGTVAFTDGSTTLCAAVAVSSGVATCTTSSLSAGDHSVTARYSGDGSFEGSSRSTTQVVSKGATSTVATASPASSVSGQLVTFTATVSVSAPAAGTPSGTVAFTDGSTTLCAAAALSSGVATCTSSSLAVGSHPVTARYSGDASFDGSSGSASGTVSKGATSTVVSASPTRPESGEVVTLTARVTITAPAAGALAGTVTFTDGATTLCSAIPLADGTATCTTSSLEVGDHAVTARYGGSPTLDGSSGSVSVTVVAAPATVAVASSRNPSRVGRPVTFTAEVSAAYVTVSGEVSFHTGDRLLGTAPIADGKATLTVRDLVRGTYPITARFAGGGGVAPGSGELSGGQVVENTPPVAGSGSAVAFGDGVLGAAGTVRDGRLDAVKTVEAWVLARPGSAPGATLVRLGEASAPRLAVQLRPDRTVLDVVIGSTTLPVAAPLADGLWHHVALTSSGGRVVVRVDNAVALDAAATLDTAGTGAVAFGAGFVGELDEVRFWNVAVPWTEMAANLRRPVKGDAAGLAALWRMDEGEGSILFDAGPAQADLVVENTAPGSAFVASAAWRNRETYEERPLPAIAAGYDADGDPLTLTVTSPPPHGAVTVDAAQLQLSYVSTVGYRGEDLFTFQLDDGQATSAYQIAVNVRRTVSCTTDADCATGDACVVNVCTPVSELDARAVNDGTSGCSTTGGSTAALWALALLALRRRRPTATQRGSRP